MKTLKNQPSLEPLKKNWTVAELKVSYKPKKRTGISITNSDSSFQVFKKMWDLSSINIQEHFCAIFLNSINEVIAFRKINTGKINMLTLDIAFLFKCALLCNATQIILAHNHPSGSLNPSKADLELTSAIKSNFCCFNIDVLDHLIITESEYYSFADNHLVFG